MDDGKLVIDLVVRIGVDDNSGLAAWRLQAFKAQRIQICWEISWCRSTGFGGIKPGTEGWASVQSDRGRYSLIAPVTALMKYPWNGNNSKIGMNAASIEPASNWFQIVWYSWTDSVIASCTTRNC